MVNASVTTATKEESTRTDVDSAPSMTAKALLALLKVIGALPISLRSAVGGSLGSIVGRLPLREVTIASLQMQAFLPEVSASATVPRVCAHVGRSMLESLNLKPLLHAPFHNISCPDWDTIIGWTKEDRPIIALTAHTGNWDLLAAYAIARGVPISTVGKEARNPNVHVVLRSMREAYGIDTVWRSDRSGVKRIVSCFKERRVMAALIDQDTRVDSVFVPFFGTPAKTPSALIELGKRFNARFVTAFIVRTKGTKFEIQTRELDDSQSVEGILTQYHHHLEQVIRANPDQWVWFHKRWRSTPSGTTLSTKEYLTMLREKIASSRR